MRKLYLVRHGHVDFPGGIRRCIGWTDLPLDDRGRRQAGQLGEYFRQIDEGQTAVFASPLTRAEETARLLAGDRMPVFIEEGLKELYMGEWENIPMNQLKKGLESWPGTGEPREEGLKRIRRAIDRILARTEGNVICVAHAGINSCFLAGLMGTPLNTSRGLPQPYGGFSVIETADSVTTGRAGEYYMKIKTLGIMPKEAPDEEECRHIWEHYHTPEPVRRHCQAVCREAVRLGKELMKNGWGLNMEVVRSGALLHDVARSEAAHPEKGASVLRREGYPMVAEVIRHHHDLECPGEGAGSGSFPSLWMETAVVYLADKYVAGDRVVSLEERFAASRKRCGQAEDKEAALEAHERRYRQARGIENLIQKEIHGGQTR